MVTCWETRLVFVKEGTDIEGGKGYKGYVVSSKVKEHHHQAFICFSNSLTFFLFTTTLWVTVIL